MALLLSGGCEDPNLAVLSDAVRRNGIELLDLRLPAAESPAFCWNPAEGAPRFSGKTLSGETLSDREISATGAFIRHDVFGAMKDPRPEVSWRALAWYQAMMGWLLSEPRVRIFNRFMSPAASNKPAALVLASQAGLRIPPTWITNHPSQFVDGSEQSPAMPGDWQSGTEGAGEGLKSSRPESMIAKPILGGDFCYSLDEALAKTSFRHGRAAMPAIVQRRLSPPEVRIYVIGQEAFAFEVRSNSLDYRVNQDAELLLLPQVPRELSALRTLMERLGLDFGAADFKTDPDTGQLVFLELNTSPMFARFDHVSSGQLCAAIIRELTSPS